MKGILNFYINYRPETGEDFKKLQELFLEANKAVFEELQVKCDYRVVITPVTNESCRMEKLDMNKPYPRSNINIDLSELQRRKAEKANKENEPKS